MNDHQHCGKRVAFIEKGSGSPVLFLHNGGTSHCIWQHQIDALSVRHHVFALDLPGYGESDPLDADYSLETYTNIIADFIATQIPEQPLTLVGNCLGSAIALCYAMRNPARVHALVLISPLTYRTFRESHFGALLGLNEYAPTAATLLSQGIRRVMLPKIGITPAIWFQIGEKGRERRLWKNASLRACYQNPNVLTALTGLYEQLPHFDFLDQLLPGKDFPPIYTLWGKQNRVLSAQAGECLNSRLRPREARTLHDCGHLLMLEQPQIVADLIERAIAPC